MRNRRFLPRERPSERIGPGTFELVEEPIPDIGDGELLVRLHWLSLDPTMRGWIRETAAEQALDQLAFAVAGMLRCHHPAEPRITWPIPTGDRYAAVPEIAGVSASTFLGALGSTGLTA